MLKLFTLVLGLFFFVSIAAQNGRDTVIAKVHYEWVKYDLNKNPYEIGQFYKNGIKNGKWLYRDQQGRLTEEVYYLNDTLNGAAAYYTYLNEPTVVKFEGLLLKGKKTGVWLSKERKNKFSSWTNFFVLMYDHYEHLLSRTYTFKNGKPKFQIFYSASGEEIWYRYYKKNGKMYKENNINPWVIRNL